jgi:hypothetical protein
VHSRRGHQILLERLISSWLHVYVLPITRFLIPEYLAYENRDRVIEVFLLIPAFKLPSSFGLLFYVFKEVVGEDLEPKGAISVT